MNLDEKQATSRGQSSPADGCRYQVTSHSPDCSVAHLSIHHGSCSPQVAGRLTVEQQDCRASLVPNRSSSAGSQTNCVQIQTLEVPTACSSRVEQGQQVCAELNHKMILDGDNYTLLILDCSPQPREGSACSGRCECASQCYGQTELHVKQQLIGHDFLCQAPMRAPTPSAPQLQHLQPPTAPHSHLLSVESSSTTSSSNNNNTRRVDQRSSQERELRMQNEPQVRHYQYQEHESILNVEPKQQQQQQQSSRETIMETLHTSDQSYSSEQVSKRRPVEEQSSGRATSGGKTKTVKRWDWNQAQFVETQIPDKPSPRPQPASRSEQHHHTSDVWHQEQPSSSLHSQPVYEPSWTAYRVPDVESVEGDPLYRDLMLELQRLEQGVSEPKQVVIEPETFQRPVFGQQITPAHLEVKEYETVEFLCRLIPNSDPSMRVEWTVNGRPLLESSRYTNEYEFGVARLRIKRCEAEDSGIYQCKAINSLGEAISTGSLRVHAKGNVQSETLNPAGLDKIRQLENPKPVERLEEQVSQPPPKFLSHISDYVEKDEGESVHFECCLAPVDDPDLKTEWFFNGRPLVTGSRFHTIDDFGFIVLDIDWLFPRDTGEYVCRATNKFGSDITRTVLRVRPDKNIILESQLDNPQVIDKLRQLEFPDVLEERHLEEPDKPAHFVQHLCSRQNRRNYVEGDNVHFEARVGPATDGQLTVEWFHNEKPLMDGHRFKPSFDFGHIQLDILYVYPEDSGVYKCVTRNATGVDVSQFEIQVKGKPSLVYDSQLPDEMVGGVKKITEMEASWNRAPDPEEEEEPAKRRPPEFTLQPKAYTAFENSCARFCCRIVGVPRPRLTWVVNGQTVVSGSRYKLTYDGMYHLIIPKCQLADAGKIEVYARNLLGECFATTELKVKRKVDDYRGVLKNSPNPWYDQQSLKIYQRHRSSQELSDDDLQDITEHLKRLQFAGEQQSGSPVGNQVIGYMEPGTPDVNLLARTQSPLVDPGDLHPVVIEQQVVMAPAPSTIQKALKAKDSISGPEKSFKFDQHRQQQQQHQQQNLNQSRDSSAQDLRVSQQVFGLDQNRQSVQSRRSSQNSQQADQQQTAGDQLGESSRLPPPSPESVVHGKEVHSHTHKQTQLERRENREIVREIIQKDIFEQEHKGVTKENVVRGASSERGSTPASDAGQIQTDANRLQQLRYQQQQYQQQMQQQQQMQYQQQQMQEQQRRVRFQEQQQQQQVLLEQNMIAPEFVHKIQPCQAVDGDEARFECSFKGEPTPTISWFRESKMIKPSNLYSILIDHDKSSLIIRRVTQNCNAVYTVKAENVAGSAKSSANLVVDPHPLAESGKLSASQQLAVSSSSARASSPSFAMASSSSASVEDQQQQVQRPDSSLSESSQSKVVKSVRTRKLSTEEMASLARASPEGMMAPTFLHTIHDMVRRPGDLCRLDARLVGSQPMELRWLKDGQRVRADRSHKMVLEGDLYTLLILECSQQDEGNYECLASNQLGEARCAAHLTISDQRGSSETRSGEQVTTSSSSSFTTSTTTASSSSGQFQQSADSQSGQRSHFGLSKHQYNPLMSQYTSAGSQQHQEIPKLIKRLENQQVVEGKSVTLRCQISSFPIAEVHWYKQKDKLIKPSKYFRIFKDNDETYCMKILETFQEDQGEYRCVARAPNGQTYVETKAIITVIPASPK